MNAMAYAMDAQKEADAVLTRVGNYAEMLSIHASSQPSTWVPEHRTELARAANVMESIQALHTRALDELSCGYVERGSELVTQMSDQVAILAKMANNLMGIGAEPRS